MKDLIILYLFNDNDNQQFQIIFQRDKNLGGNKAVCTTDNLPRDTYLVWINITCTQSSKYIVLQ